MARPVRAPLLLSCVRIVRTRVQQSSGTGVPSPARKHKSKFIVYLIKIHSTAPQFWEQTKLVWQRWGRHSWVVTALGGYQLSEYCPLLVLVDRELAAGIRLCDIVCPATGVLCEGLQMPDPQE